MSRTGADQRPNLVGLFALCFAIRLAKIALFFGVSSGRSPIRVIRGLLRPWIRESALLVCCAVALPEITFSSPRDPRRATLLPCLPFISLRRIRHGERDLSLSLYISFSLSLSTRLSLSFSFSVCVTRALPPTRGVQKTYTYLPILPNSLSLSPSFSCALGYRLPRSVRKTSRRYLLPAVVAEKETQYFMETDRYWGVHYRYYPALYESISRGRGKDKTGMTIADKG